MQITVVRGVSANALSSLQAVENLPENGTIELKAREALRFCVTVEMILQSCLMRTRGTDASIHLLRVQPELPRDLLLKQLKNLVSLRYGCRSASRNQT